MKDFSTRFTLVKRWTLVALEHIHHHFWNEGAEEGYCEEVHTSRCKDFPNCEMPLFWKQLLLRRSGRNATAAVVCTMVVLTTITWYEASSQSMTAGVDILAEVIRPLEVETGWYAPTCSSWTQTVPDPQILSNENESGKEAEDSTDTMNRSTTGWPNQAFREWNTYLCRCHSTEDFPHRDRVLPKVSVDPEDTVRWNRWLHAKSEILWKWQEELWMWGPLVPEMLNSHMIVHAEPYWHFPYGWERLEKNKRLAIKSSWELMYRWSLACEQQH